MTKHFLISTHTLNIHLSLSVTLLKALAGFYTYFVVMGSFGFKPGFLPGNGVEWDDEEYMVNVLLLLLFTTLCRVVIIYIYYVCVYKVLL